jgi:hypothetical protein
MQCHDFYRVYSLKHAKRKTRCVHVGGMTVSFMGGRLHMSLYDIDVEVQISDVYYTRYIT